MFRISVLADQPLPLLPETADALRQLHAERDTRNSSLQEVILKDPAAALAVLQRLVELHPESAAEVIDLAHALSLLGPAAFRALIADLAPLAAADATRAAVVRAHYARAAHAAYYARAWGRSKGWASLDGLATAALLQCPAELAFAVSDHAAAVRAADATRAGTPWRAAYATEFGLDPSTASRELAVRWRLPRKVTAAIGADANATPAARLAALAADLGRASLLDWMHEDLPALVGALAGVLGTGEAAAWSALHQQAVAAARELGPLHYPAAAFALPQPGAEPCLSAAAGQTLTPTAGDHRGREQTTPRRLGRHSAQLTMASAMREMLELTGVARVVFFKLSRDCRSLRARLALGVQEHDPMRNLTLSLTTRHLFERLITTPQSVWFNGENATTYRDHLPYELLEAGLGGEFFAMSLVVAHRAIGVLFGDGARLSERGYRQFRQLCQETAEALSAGRKAA
jgi:HD-like signal output (HDOD) protein